MYFWTQNPMVQPQPEPGKDKLTAHVSALVTWCANRSTLDMQTLEINACVTSVPEAHVLSRMWALQSKSPGIVVLSWEAAVWNVFTAGLDWNACCICFAKRQKPPSSLQHPHESCHAIPLPESMSRDNSSKTRISCFPSQAATVSLGKHHCQEHHGNPVICRVHPRLPQNMYKPLQDTAIVVGFRSHQNFIVFFHDLSHGWISLCAHTLTYNTVQKT